MIRRKKRLQTADYWEPQHTVIIDLQIKSAMGAFQVLFVAMLVALASMEARGARSVSIQAVCPNPPLQKVDVEAYTGVWYEIGSTAQFKKQAEQDLICSSVRYSIIPSGPLKGKVRVLNSGYNSSSAQLFSIIGYADLIQPGKLAVHFTFTRPPGDYRIIYVMGQAATKYDVAIVYSCSSAFGFISEALYVISRTPQLPRHVTVNDLLKVAYGVGIKLQPDDQFILTPQDPKTCGRLFYS